MILLRGHFLARWLAVALVATVGCGHFSREEGERLTTEVYGLQSQLQKLETEVDALKKDEETQREQLATLIKDVGSLNKIARRNDADLGVELDEMKELLSRLRGLVEGFNERVIELETATSKTQEEIEVRFQGLAEQQKIEKAKTEKEKKQAIAAARQRERLIANPSKALAEAKKLIDKGEPAEARLLVRELMLQKKKTRSLRRQLPYAQFLIGETFYAEENYQQAAAEYNTVRKNHSRSKYVPEALYRLGQCFEKLNLKEDAKLFYTTVVQKYGKYKVAKKAKKALSKL